MPPSSRLARRSFMWTALVMLAPPFTSPCAPFAADEDIATQARAALADVAAVDGPGAAVLIARGDTVVYRGSRGRADIESGLALAPEQVFQIASITKTFTAALMVRLASEHRLGLDDPLARYLPGFPRADTITPRQLLTHTAGISDRRVTSGPWPRPLTLADQVRDIATRPAAFAPGSRQAYSNAGFVLLGAVIEKVTGQPWYTALDRRLLQPLGLTHTRYGGSRVPVAGRVIGYSTDNPQGRIETVTSIDAAVPASAGGLISTTDDLFRWMRALATGRAVGADGFAQMTTPAVLPDGPSREPYGFGTYVWRLRGDVMVGHTGQIDGFASALLYLPRSEVTVVVLANDDHFDARLLARRLAAIAAGRPFAIVTSRTVTPTLAAAVVGRYRIDAETVESLSVTGGRLVAQRGSRTPLPLQEGLDGSLHFVPDELSYFMPVRDARDTVIRLDYYRDGEGPPVAYPRLHDAP